MRPRKRNCATGTSQMKLAILVAVLTLCTLFAPIGSHKESEELKRQHEDEASVELSNYAQRAHQNEASQAQLERRQFVLELLKELHEEHGHKTANELLEQRRSGSATMPRNMAQLLEAIGAEADMRRLLDWVKGSLDLASIPEVATQFVVSKLGAVNCLALLSADKEESLVPRFLLFNEHFADVPFELDINPSANDCAAGAKFDPNRKTVVLIHGFLGGYTLVDGLTNLKNRLLDLNRLTSERAIETFERASQQLNASYVFTDDINMKIRSQLYNVIIVDWFKGANPTPRANYIRSAVNAQVVGKLIARFLSALVAKCGAEPAQMQLIGHSLGCHVAGFTGKAMNEAGHRLAKITHLDPVGLCFGRLFSRPSYRLSANDALETQAVHVSLNVFDNPLDGAHSNFLVNGGRDQPGCGHQNEVSNSTKSSVALLLEPSARFAPCSHLRAFALFEDDWASAPNECQYVGYRCANYERFLAGKCAHCDATNAQCRLMGLTPASLQFGRMLLGPTPRGLRESELDHHYPAQQDDRLASASTAKRALRMPTNSTTSSSRHSDQTTRPLAGQARRSSKPSAARHLVRNDSDQLVQLLSSNELGRRSDAARLDGHKRERITQAIERWRTDTRSALAGFRPTQTTKLSGELDVESHRKPDANQAESVELGNKETKEDDEDEDDDYENRVPTNEGAESSNYATQAVALSEAPSIGSTQKQATTPGPIPVEAARPVEAEIRRPIASDHQAGVSEKESSASHRFHDDGVIDQIPLGGQPIPAGSLNGPLFFLGTGSLAPFCVNYYQFRVLIAESRLRRVISQNGLASNRLKAQYNERAGGILSAIQRLQQQPDGPSGRDMLHLTVKLTDSMGHFFKGFSLLESVRLLDRVMNDFVPSPGAPSFSGQLPGAGLNEPMLEITLLLNSTRSQPTKVSETIISYYFHPVVLADRVEVNYLSNISPEIRSKYSSVLCPVAINDRHQLVKYIECNRVSKRRKRR